MVNLDGMDKNMSKFKRDYKALRNLEDGRPSDWLKAPWNVHHWTDMFVESARAAPYLMGHVYAIGVPVTLVIFGFMVYFC